MGADWEEEGVSESKKGTKEMMKLTVIKTHSIHV